MALDNWLKITNGSIVGLDREKNFYINYVIKNFLQQYKELGSDKYFAKQLKTHELMDEIVGTWFAKFAGKAWRLSECDPNMVIFDISESENKSIILKAKYIYEYDLSSNNYPTIYLTVDPNRNLLSIKGSTREKYNTGTMIRTAGTSIKKFK